MPSKKPAAKKPRSLDKSLVEAGLHCRKRLYLDLHHPVRGELPPARAAMAEAGRKLVEIACSVFPKGVAVGGDDAAAATTRLLAEGAPVLFGATFAADGVEVVSDILVRHKDGAVDLYEVKSGAKVKQRYIVDLALQTHVLEACGHALRAAFLLNLNPRYEHKEGADYPPMQLLRSTDVTAKVRKQLPHLRARLDDLRAATVDAAVLEQPMGSWCVQPARCHHAGRCGESAPALPVHELPELTRELEIALRAEGVTEITAIDPSRPGLSFVQRRVIECLRSGQPIVEGFVAEELRQCAYPLHFVAIGAVTEALPRFDGQRPWRRVPYGWAARTLYDDGRIEAATFAHAERSDPRFDFATSLGKHVGNGGTVLCWNDETIEGLRALLEDLPRAKVAVRAVIGRSLLDLMHLFEAGVFHPDLLRTVDGRRDLVATVAALLDDDSGKDLDVRDENDLREVLEKAWAPRIRAATREKLAARITDSLDWQSQRLLDLFRRFSGVAEKKRETKSRQPTKTLPPLSES